MSSARTHLQSLWLLCCCICFVAATPARAQPARLAQSSADVPGPPSGAGNEPAKPAPTDAAPETASAGNGELLSLLRGTKVLDPSYNLAATVSSDEILITTQRKPGAADSECKIKAVLLSKAAFDAVPKGPQRCRLMFLDLDSDSFVEITVKRAAVKLFGAGGLSQKDLLASLELNASKGSSSVSAAVSVVPGPMQPERMMTLERINRLKQKGTNVTVFKNLFDKVEDAAKQGQIEQTKKQLISLNDHLKDQEQMLKNAAALKNSPALVSSQSSETKAADAPASGVPDVSTLMQLFGHHHGGHRDWLADNDPKENYTPEQVAKYQATINRLYASVNAKMKRLSSLGFNTQRGLDWYGEITDLIKEKRLRQAVEQLEDLDQAADRNLRQIRR